MSIPETKITIWDGITVLDGVPYFPPLMGINQIAIYWQMSPGHVARLLKDNLVPKTTKTKYSKEDLDNLKHFILEKEKQDAKSYLDRKKKREEMP